MSEKTDLLIEVGLEELPHSFIENAMKGFENNFTGQLSNQKIEFGKVTAFSTPRRMTLFIKEVNINQNDYLEEKRGPSIEKAYLPDGSPSKALTGFLKGNNITKDDIATKVSENREYVFLLREIKGKDTFTLLPEILDITLKSLYFPKTMKWENTGFQFARPIRWILYLFGETIVPFKIADVVSSNYTYGHRSYGNSRIVINNPTEYEKKLSANSVIADRYKRKLQLQKQIEKIIIPKGLEVPEIAKDLYDINNDLTEFPHAVICEFDKYFLELPVEVLTSEMIEHQYYFPLIEGSKGKLSNYFIAVSNICEKSKSVYGYQNVLRARLDDGRFFFNEDKKKGFSEYSEKLKTVTFHEQLGSMHQKIERIMKISEVLAGLVSLNNKEKASVCKTAELCKNDLVTLTVNEFPGLQGIMGYYYARASDYSEDVARGIKEHYYPRFAADILPSCIEGSLVGIADRLDTILGIFSIGLKPKGSKDPFALRRKVFAIVKIIISMKLNYSMRKLIADSAGLYSCQKSSALVMDEVEGFFIDRIKSIFTEMGFLYDEIDACISNVMDDIYEAYKRVLALHEFRSHKDFEDLLISFKRMGNILKEEKKFLFSEDLLIEKEEKTLYRHFISVKDRIVENVNIKNYNQVYSILSTFKPHVDNFFDNVLVMDENMELRENRVGLLKVIINIFSDIIDISKIVPG